MTKVMIIAYYYPPSSFVGGKRIAFWAQNLQKHGIYPIILTRKWNINQKDLFDEIENNAFEINKNSTHEVHFIPVKDRWKIYFSKKPYLNIFRKVLILFELLFGRTHIALSPYKSFFDYADKLLKKDSDIKSVLVSGRPFEMFQVGYALKRKLPIKWIPDYRDEWNTHQNNDRNNHSLIKRLILPLDRRYEVKWTKNADYFISVSDKWVENIQKMINIEGHIVMNGYKKYEPIQDNTIESVFKIIYAGTIYESQPIEIFIEAIQIIISNNKYQNIKIEVLFIGTEIEVFGHEKLKKITKNKSIFKFLPRLDRNQLETEMAKADLLLLTNFYNVRGWYPVKLFDYFATGKPILLVPSDHDVMAEFIRNVNCGYVCEDETSCIHRIEELLMNKTKNFKYESKINEEYSSKFSREFQTKILADLLKRHHCN